MSFQWQPFKITDGISWLQFAVSETVPFLQIAIDMAREHVAKSDERGDSVYQLCFLLYTGRADDITPHVINTISLSPDPIVKALVPAMVHALITSPEKVVDSLVDAGTWPVTTWEWYVDAIEKTEGEADELEEALLVTTLISKLPSWMHGRLKKFFVGMDKRYVEKKTESWRKLLPDQQT